MLLDTHDQVEPQHPTKPVELVKTLEPFPPELMDVTTGEILDRKDADALIGAYQRVDRHQRQLYDLRRSIGLAIADLAEGEGRTLRVRGKKRKAKVELPDEGLNQAKLKEAWHAYPGLRDELLRIDSLGLKKREFKKAENTSGPPDYENFKHMIQTAITPPSGTPKITVEE